MDLCLATRYLLARQCLLKGAACLHRSCLDEANMVEVEKQRVLSRPHQPVTLKV